jgi:hypothetical protein
MWYFSAPAIRRVRMMADVIFEQARCGTIPRPIELHLRQGQPYNYAAMPTPEGRQARAIILRVVAQGLT